MLIKYLKKTKKTKNLVLLFLVAAWSHSHVVKLCRLGSDPGVSIMTSGAPFSICVRLTVLFTNYNVNPSTSLLDIQSNRQFKEWETSLWVGGSGCQQVQQAQDFDPRGQSSRPINSNIRVAGFVPLKARCFHASSAIFFLTITKYFCCLTLTVDPFCVKIQCKRPPLVLL